MKPTTSAIVLNYRMAKDTVQCVQALSKQTIIDQMEIIVVDNHSDDESMGILRAQLQNIPHLRIVEAETNGGFGSGNNFGASYAQGEYLLFINPDNTMGTNDLERMIQTLKERPDVGILGPALVYPGGAVRPSARPFPRIRDIVLKRLFEKRWKMQQKSYQSNNDIQEVDWIVGACMLMSARLYKELHGFDTRFFLFFEDTDLCKRCQSLGYKVLYVPSIKLMDRKERLSDGGILSLLTKKTARIHVASAIKYFYKWKSGLTANAN